MAHPAEAIANAPELVLMKSLLFMSFRCESGKFSGSSILFRSSRSPRCFAVRRCGTSKMMRTTRSPVPMPRRDGMPLPRKRKSFPFGVPDGILRLATPSGVGTSTDPPTAAMIGDTGTSTARSSPSLTNISESRTRTTTYRSPGSPPRRPPPPFPVRRRREPVSTPLGILRATWRLDRICPEPWH